MAVSCSLILVPARRECGAGVACRLVKFMAFEPVAFPLSVVIVAGEAQTPEHFIMLLSRFPFPYSPDCLVSFAHFMWREVVLGSLLNCFTVHQTIVKPQKIENRHQPIIQSYISAKASVRDCCKLLTSQFGGWTFITRVRISRDIWI